MNKKDYFAFGAGITSVLVISFVFFKFAHWLISYTPPPHVVNLDFKIWCEKHDGIYREVDKVGNWGCQTVDGKTLYE